MADELSAEEWQRTYREAGIADVDLAEAGLDAEAEPKSASARHGSPEQATAAAVVKNQPRS